MPGQPGMNQRFGFSFQPVTDIDSRFNSSLANARRQNLNGVYNVHTNVMQYPKIMQPTYARWEQVPPPNQKSPVSPYSIDHVNKNNDDSDDAVAETDIEAEGLFPDIPPVFARNFMITDTYYVTPITSTQEFEGLDEDVTDTGLGGITQISERVLEALPEDCRRCVIKARSNERAWKEIWGSQHDDLARARLRITYNV